MQKTWRLLIRARIWKDQQGQDLIEYAMIAGFLAVVLGMFMPNVSQDVSFVVSKIRAL